VSDIDIYFAKIEIYLQPTSFFCYFPLCLLYTLEDGRSSDIATDAAGAGSILGLIMRGRKI
jgi:hypothetical protein